MGAPYIPAVLTGVIVLTLLDHTGVRRKCVHSKTVTRIVAVLRWLSLPRFCMNFVF